MGFIHFMNVQSLFFWQYEFQRVGHATEIALQPIFVFMRDVYRCLVLVERDLHRAVICFYSGDIALFGVFRSALLLLKNHTNGLDRYSG